MKTVKIEKEKRIEEVTYDELVNILMTQTREDFVHVLMFTDVRMYKRNVPTNVKDMKVKKLSSRNYRLSNYQKRVISNMEKEGMERNFTSQKRNGMTRVSDFVFQSDKNENVYYLSLEPFNEVKGQYDFYNPSLDPITEQDEIDLIKQYMYKHYKPSTQKQEKEVLTISPKIENIWSITLNGVKYIRTDFGE